MQIIFKNYIKNKNIIVYKMQIPLKNIKGTLPTCQSKDLIGVYDTENQKIILIMKNVEGFELEIDMKFLDDITKK